MAKTRRKTPAVQSAATEQADLPAATAGPSAAASNVVDNDAIIAALTSAGAAASGGLDANAGGLSGIEVPQQEEGNDFPAPAPFALEDEEEGVAAVEDIPTVAEPGSLFVKPDGSPERFWFAPDCLDLATLKLQVVNNGGQVVNMKKQADFIVLDDRAPGYDDLFKGYSESAPSFKEATPAIDHIWVRDSATYGKRFELASYIAKDRAFERKQMERRLTRRKPRGFTDRDKDVLAKFLLKEEQRCKRENERMYWMGNVLYDKLAARDPTHTAQSWREHFKLKRDDIVARMESFRQQFRDRDMLSDDDEEEDQLASFEAIPVAESSSQADVGHRSKRVRTEEPAFGLAALSASPAAGFGGPSTSRASGRQGKQHEAGSSLRMAAARRDSDDDGVGQAFFDAPESQSRAIAAHQSASAGRTSISGALNSEATLKAAGGSLSREFRGLLTPQQGTDLVYACQTVDRAKHFARHLYPAGYTPSRDSTESFNSRVQGFLQFNPAVWSPMEDEMALEKLGTDSERVNLANIKKGSGVTLTDRINFLRKINLPVGQTRFPFTA